MHSFQNTFTLSLLQSIDDLVPIFNVVHSLLHVILLFSSLSNLLFKLLRLLAQYFLVQPVCISLLLQLIHLAFVLFKFSLGLVEVVFDIIDLVCLLIQLSLDLVPARLNVLNFSPLAFNNSPAFIQLTGQLVQRNLNLVFLCSQCFCLRPHLHVYLFEVLVNLLQLLLLLCKLCFNRGVFSCYLVAILLNL